MKLLVTLYFLIFTSGIVWGLSPRPAPKPAPAPPPTSCPTGWTKFSRPTGAWCIKVFQSPVEHPEAQRQCASQGGVLSGIQNYEELNFMTSEVLKHVDSGSIWIGAQRTEACRAQLLNEECTVSNSFQWTDGSATGAEGFYWNWGQPDNGFERTQNCILLLASNSARVMARNLIWDRNRLDDVQCLGVQGLIAETSRAIYGYACGKKPSN